jgi:3-isopropylmalate/(R)-2-methylmalate dehydratase small subunit
VNLGLNLIICPTLEAEEGDEVEVLPGKVVNTSTGKEFPTVPLPPARQAIIDAGGLIPFTRKKMLETAPR